MILPSLPSVSVHCLTYGRPFQLEEAIYSFLHQDYNGQKEMVILNDLKEQELLFSHPEVRIVNSNYRYLTLGDARNALTSQQNGEIIVQLDDDDIILPNYLSNCVQLLGDKDWIMPNNGLTLYKHNFKLIEGSGSHITFRKSAWQRVGGYSSMNSGEDWDFIHKLEKQTKGSLVPVKLKDIGYIYTWYNNVYNRATLQDSSGLSSTNTVQGLISKEIELKRLPQGKIHLVPQWNHNYIGIVSEFIKSHK